MAVTKFLVTGGATGIQQDTTVATSAGAGDSGKIPNLDTNGKLDSTFMPTGFGSDTITVTAGETLAATDLIYLDGSGDAWKADATTSGKQAMGFVLSGITAAASGTAYVGSAIITGLSGLTPGAIYYLSTTGGDVTTTAPTGSANVQQQVGVALTTTTLSFEPQQGILLL